MFMAEKIAYHFEILVLNIFASECMWPHGDVGWILSEVCTLFRYRVPVLMYVRSNVCDYRDHGISDEIDSSVSS